MTAGERPSYGYIGGFNKVTTGDPVDLLVSFDPTCGDDIRNEQDITPRASRIAIIKAPSYSGSDVYHLPITACDFTPSRCFLARMTSVFDFHGQVLLDS
jgi:hypothetical protein